MPPENSTIKNRFLSDKESLINQTQSYLQSNPTTPVVVPLDQTRANVVDAVKSGNFSEALQGLEEMRDARSGVAIIKVKGDGPTPTVIRDARNCKNPAERGTESFEAQAINAYRAAIDIAELEGKPELAATLKQGAVNFITSFHDQNSQKSQEELSGLAKEVTKGIVSTMEEHGIKKAGKALNIAKDFQNFNDEHSNIVTLTSVTKDGATHTVVEAEVGMKGLTNNQKKEFEPVISGQGAKPDWYQVASPIEQKLIDKYSPTIAEGNHVIPTQLRGTVPGMRNAFEKVTAVMESGSDELEVLHTSKHAGTLASLVKGGADLTKQRLTNQNAAQVQEWMGTDTKVHCNTLNSRRPGGEDTEIINSTTAGMKSVGGKETNTAFNGFRIAGYASDVTGAKDFLKELSNSVEVPSQFLASEEERKAINTVRNNLEPKGIFGKMAQFFEKPSLESAMTTLENSSLSKDNFEALRNATESAKAGQKVELSLKSDNAAEQNLLKKFSKEVDPAEVATEKKLKAAMETVQDHMKPKGFFGRMMRSFGPSPDQALETLSSAMDPESLGVLKDAMALARNVEKADANIRLGDKENVSLAVSTGLNQLTTKIRNNDEIDLGDKKLPKEEVLTMCASGKDRTGLAEHDQTAQAVSARFGIDIKDVDKAVLAGGHTAQQAGSIHAGGGTLGCHGTKSENKAGIPDSRKDSLESIVEASSKNNKIKDTKVSMFKKLKNMILGKQGSDREATEEAVLDNIEEQREVAAATIATPEKQVTANKDLEVVEHSSEVQDVMKKLSKAGVKDQSNKSQDYVAPNLAANTKNKDTGMVAG